MSICIDIRNLFKKYDTPVLKGVSFTLESGHFYALLGQNGAGKSTLMKILMRSEAPDQGDGRIMGYDISKDLPETNQHVGYVSEAINYMLDISVGEFPVLYSKQYPRWDSELFYKYLSLLQLDRNKNYAALSRGQRMQVALAVALSIRPKLLLLDEITSVLDAGARVLLMGELGRFVQEGGTVLMATNIVSEVHAYADRVLLLEDGQMKMDLPIADVAQKFRILRKPKGQEHSIFETPDCVLVGVDSDQSLLYLVPTSTSLQGIPAQLIEARPAHLAEAFIYFTRKKVA